MKDEPVRGTLHLVLRPGQPSSAEDRLSFGTLQQLLDLCTRHQGTAAFGRVEILGDSGGRQMRLVLDFGQFSAWKK